MIRRIAALPLWAKVALGVIALLVGIALSPFTRFVAILVLIVSSVALIWRLLRRRPLRGWAIVGLVALVAIPFFGATTDALFSGRSSQQEQASTPSESEEDAKKETPAEESTQDTIPVQIRVSGTPGTPYSCKNSSFAFEEGKSDPVRYEEDISGTLGTEPVLYDSQAVNTYPHNLDFVGASCRNTAAGPNRPAAGSLKVELLADGEVKAEEETRPDPPGKKSIESEHVQPRWAPKCPNHQVDWDCG